MSKSIVFHRVLIVVLLVVCIALFATHPAFNLVTGHNAGCFLISSQPSNNRVITHWLFVSGGIEGEGSRPIVVYQNNGERPLDFAKGNGVIKFTTVVNPAFHDLHLSVVANVNGGEAVCTTSITLPNF